MFKKVNLRVLIVLLISIISSLLIGKFGEKLLPTENDLNLWLGYVIGFLLGGVAVFTDFGLRNPNNLK
jgi:hypothetical protein